MHKINPHCALLKQKIEIECKQRSIDGSKDRKINQSRENVYRELKN